MVPPVPPVPIAPAAPGPEPALPGPEPALPEPEPALPGPEPALPGPEPALPGLEPAVPGPEPALPEPEPALPEPEPAAPEAPALPVADEPAAPVLPPLLKPQLTDATPAAQHNRDVRKPEWDLDVGTVDMGSPLGGVFGELQLPKPRVTYPSVSVVRVVVVMLHFAESGCTGARGAPR